MFGPLASFSLLRHFKHKNAICCKKKKKKVGETITVRRLVRLRLLLEGKPRTLSRTLFVFADGNVNVEWRRRARFERSKTEARMNRADAA